MFQPTTLHTDFARQVQADRTASIRIERRSHRSLLARVTRALPRSRAAALDRAAHAAA